VGTIDGFQGQEKEVIIINTVRSNPSGKIGFLKDEKRMNVAMSRARELLIIIGNSETL
jgi:superfamily I DNA and/or RNA helicase